VILLNEQKTLDFLHHPAPIAEALRKEGSSDAANVEQFAELNKLLGEKFISEPIISRNGSVTGKRIQSMQARLLMKLADRRY